MPRPFGALFILGGFAMFIGGFIEYRKSVGLLEGHMLTKGIAFAIILLGTFLFLGVGMYILLGEGQSHKSVSPKRGALLKQKGVKVIGTIFNIKHVPNIRINGRAPYVFEIKSREKENFVFVSNYIWLDYQELKGFQGKEIPVYVDTLEHIQSYFTDLEAIGIHGGVRSFGRIVRISGVVFLVGILASVVVTFLGKN